MAAEKTDWAYVALGANLPSSAGDPRSTLQAAAEALQALSELPLQLSSWWETAPIDCPPGSPRYINGMAALWPSSSHDPFSLLRALQGIEEQFGRQRSGLVNEARTLDLDLIVWGDRRSDTAELTLPHPRAHERAFVLAPLAELAPDMRFPGQSRTVQALLDALPDQGICRLTS